MFFYVLEGFTGQTPGKMILGITVANMNGKKATIDKLLLKFCVRPLGYMLLGWVRATLVPIF